jgi:GINS complex subunit 3
MPEALSERVMNALKADPRTIDLRALAPHFYNLSERILELFEEEEMVEVLGDVSGYSVSCIEACVQCS